MEMARCSDVVLPDPARIRAAGTTSRWCLESAARAAMAGCVSGAGAPEIPFFWFWHDVRDEEEKKCPDPTADETAIVRVRSDRPKFGRRTGA